MRKIFVLDTSVLVYDPNSYLSFKENDVIIPITVLDELDKVKKFANESGKNARVAIRNLDAISNLGEIHNGITIDDDIIIKIDASAYGALGLDPTYGDSKILACAAKAKDAAPDSKVILVSKDINLRTRAKAFGLIAQDYEKDKIPSSDLFEGFQSVKNQEAGLELFSSGYITIANYPELADLYPNECILLIGNDGKGIAAGRRVKNEIRLINDRAPWGLSLRNKEQLFATDLLLDPSVPLVTLIGRAGTGKAQPLDAKVLKPTGFSTMGEINVGDFVIGSDGNPKKVLSVFPQGEKDIFSVKFSDGTETECCDEHLWETKTSKDRDCHRSGSVKSLSEIRKTLKYGKKNNHSIPMIKPVNFSESYVPIDPYLLGVLIGDGCLSRNDRVSLTTSDVEIIEKCQEYIPSSLKIIKKSGSNYDYYISKGNKKKEKNLILDNIRNLGLSGKLSFEKFIPDNYKYNSVKNRLAILQGLMDTDGFCSENGIDVIFYTTSQILSEDVKFLVQSLGGKAVIKEKQTYFTYKNVKKTGKLSFAVYISMPEDLVPFRLTRKLNRFIPRTKYKPTKYIIDIVYIGKKQAKCILINSSDHLYATDNFILTHNTLVSLACGLEMTLEKKITSKMVIYRPIQPMGNDIGYLPGTLEEKLQPWMSAITDGFEFLLEGSSKNREGWRNKMHQFVDEGRIQMEALTYVRGRSIPNSFILVDEAQNLSKEEVKTILTRAGIGTKVVLTGDISQIDNSYLDATNNGLAYVVDRFKESELSGHITFSKGERSPLATVASEIL